MNTITVHQLEHIPHLSLFKKFSIADIIVLGDIFQFKKNYYENRNKIKANNEQGWQWITVPTEKNNHKPINEVQIICDGKWQQKYLKTIECIYSKMPYFDKYYYYIAEIISDEYYIHKSIADLNLTLLTAMMSWFGINKLVYLTSQMDLNSKLKGTDLLVEICKKMKADTYISGPSGKDYLELEKFGDIKVIFHEKEEGLSAIDHLFRYGGTLE